MRISRGISKSCEISRPFGHLQGPRWPDQSPDLTRTHPNLLRTRAQSVSRRAYLAYPQSKRQGNTCKVGGRSGPVREIQGHVSRVLSPCLGRTHSKLLGSQRDVWDKQRLSPWELGPNLGRARANLVGSQAQSKRSRGQFTWDLNPNFRRLPANPECSGPQSKARVPNPRDVRPNLGGHKPHVMTTKPPSARSGGKPLMILVYVSAELLHIA